MVNTRLAHPAILAVALLTPAHRTAPQPELFAPGIVSTRDYERDGTFTPDGRTFYYTKRTIWPGFSAICVTHLRSGRWSTPEVASFSGRFADVTPSISPDGSRIYFASRRPNGSDTSSSYRLWYANRTANGWDAPHALSDSINNAGGVIAPVAVSDGSLYFVSGATAHVMVAHKLGDSWGVPVLAGDSSATGSVELSAYVDPRERYMIVSVAGRADALASAEGVYARADLYVRTRSGDGWSSLTHLDAPINSAAEELSPFVSPDGRYLYFTSERGAFTEHGSSEEYDGFERALHATGNGLGDIYRIPFSATGIAP